jgi:hypothetical protein
MYDSSMFSSQITAARVTADAAVAVQSGDLEGAANAVIDAINAVNTKGSNSSTSASKAADGKSGKTVHSKLCVIL